MTATFPTAHALSALLQRGMKADFLICSGRLGTPTFLNSSKVRELRSSEMGIGCHGGNHRHWRNLGSPELQEKLVGSREVRSGTFALVHEADFS